MHPCYTGRKMQTCYNQDGLFAHGTARAVQAEWFG